MNELKWLFILFDIYNYIYRYRYIWIKMKAVKTN